MEFDFYIGAPQRSTLVSDIPRHSAVSVVFQEHLDSQFIQSACAIHRFPLKIPLMCLLSHCLFCCCIKVVYLCLNHIFQSVRFELCRYQYQFRVMSSSGHNHGVVYTSHATDKMQILSKRNSRPQIIFEDPNTSDILLSSSGMK